jgi:hypothetical protein
MCAKVVIIIQTTYILCKNEPNMNQRCPMFKLQIIVPLQKINTNNDGRTKENHYLCPVDWEKSFRQEH